MSLQRDISVVVPVYRSVESLQPLYQRLAKTLTQRGLSFEVIFVEDGGPIQSWNALQELHQQFPQTTRIIQLDHNYGQDNATRCGIQHAHGDRIITIDDDLQTPPEEISRLLATPGDVIFGISARTGQAAIRQKLAGLYQQSIELLTGKTLGSSFRLITAEAREVLQNDPSDRFINQSLQRAALTVQEVEVQHLPRPQGESGYSWLKLIQLSFRVLFPSTRSQITYTIKNISE